MELGWAGRSRSVRMRQSQASTGLPHGSFRIHGGSPLRLFVCLRYVFLQEFRDDMRTGLPEHGEVVPGN